MIRKFLITLLFVSILVTISFAKERAAEIAFDFNIPVPDNTRQVRLWIPYVVSDENQEVYDVNIKGNFSYQGIFKEGKNGNSILYAEWNGGGKEKVLSYKFKIKRKEVVTKSFPQKELSFSAGEFVNYLKPAKMLAIDGKVAEYSRKITKGKKTILAKARAIYDWIVDNMYRDPNVKGCGYGEVEKLLETRGGKCADIHSVFVALARASGIPAREIFGIRIPKGKEGDMTKAQHCWAEFYLPGYGWVVVDPADVRKAILEQKLTLEEAKPLREYFFGAVDENRIAFGTGRDIVLNPPQSSETLNYFMYPYVEVDGKPLNEDIYGFNLGYKIGFKSL